MPAGHSIKSEYDCNNTKFVFGFGIYQEGVYPQSVPAVDVFSCKAIVGRAMQGSGADWALIRLDKTVTNHKPLAINRSGSIAKATPLFVIGHPAGLPTKIAGGASVRNASPAGYFVANLDTYGGNSGSAVFNNTTGKVEGILVRGETDYVYRGRCRVSNVCANDGCRGEDVTKISALSHLIPALENEQAEPEIIFPPEPPVCQESAKAGIGTQFMNQLKDMARSGSPAQADSIDNILRLGENKPVRVR
ncbi:MAG: trypsin-like peptidase domain-containing protein [Elusimicrobia bacterium]|nr:trypsin-like peptidase domain-containing protein [Elusimicrobiota bacterium]